MYTTDSRQPPTVEQEKGHFSLNTTGLCSLFQTDAAFLRSHERFFGGAGSNAALMPTVECQDDEAYDRSSPTPLVPHFLEIAQLAVRPFDMIVGTHTLAGRTV